jgi:hypothetical protein
MFERFGKPKIEKIVADQLYEARIHLLTSEHQLESAKSAVEIGRERVARLEAHVAKFESPIAKRPAG